MRNDTVPEPVIGRDATYHRAPEGLRERVLQTLAAEPSVESRTSWRPWALAASFILVAATSWNAALWHEGTTRASNAMDVALDAHVRSLAAPGRLVDVASSDQHTVKPWFIGKVDLAPPVVDLAAQGFPLAGGRLDFLDGRPAAALVYRRNAHVVNVFIASGGNAADSEPVSTMRRGYAIARWRQGGLAYEAVGDISAKDMATLVELLRRG